MKRSMVEGAECANVVMWYCANVVMQKGKWAKGWVGTEQGTNREGASEVQLEQQERSSERTRGRGGRKD